MQVVDEEGWVDRAWNEPPLRGLLQARNRRQIDSFHEVRQMDGWRCRLQQLSLQQASMRWVFGEKGVDLVQEVRDALSQMVAAFEAAGKKFAHDYGDAFQSLIQHRRVEGVLCFEVIEDSGFTGLGRDGDVLDRGAREALLGEQLRRRLENRPPAVRSGGINSLATKHCFLYHAVSLCWGRCAVKARSYRLQTTRCRRPATAAMWPLISRSGTALMAITIRETFQVDAPIDAVWRFVMDPQQVATCMPGAELEEAIDDQTFLGNISVKVGAITSSYKGRVQFTQVDEESYTVEMSAEGRETGGGIAKGRMSSRLRSLPDGRTEVVAEATVDLAGRIMQVGRGMIQGVSHQLFQQFVACAKARLEAPAGITDSAASDAAAEPIRILPLVLQTIWSAIARFFKGPSDRAAS